MFEFLLILTQIQSQQRQPHSYSIVTEEKVFGPLVRCGIMLTFSKAIKDTVQIELHSTNVNKCKLLFLSLTSTKN